MKDEKDLNSTKMDQRRKTPDRKKKIMLCVSYKRTHINNTDNTHADIVKTQTLPMRSDK
jgi:hypothetical protein